LYKKSRPITVGDEKIFTMIAYYVKSFDFFGENKSALVIESYLAMPLHCAFNS